MKYSNGWRMTCFAALLACGAHGATGTLATAEELFRWGEYDSLVLTLEPLIQGPEPDAPTDSTERARALLYLGVAYFAKGAMDRAETAFRRACAGDAGLELDEFYVTPAIAAHFEMVKSEDRRKRLEQETLGRAVRSTPAVTPALPPRPREMRPIVKEDRRWVWWGLGTAALVTAGGAVYLYAHQSSGPRESVTTLDLRGDR